MPGPRVISAKERLGLIAAFAVLWLASTGALFWYGKRIDNNGHHTAHALEVAQGALGKAATFERALRLAQIANCHRGNERTVSDNKAQLDDYRFDTSITRLLRHGLARPQIALPGVDLQRATEERAEATELLVTAERAAKGKTWHHLIENCTYAIDHPATYVLPPAVRFSRTGRHHTPPVGALRVERGE